MVERDIEKYLVAKVRSIGGQAMKWVSPGNAGVPDRIVCLPNGVIHFVECKAPGKKPTIFQEQQIRKLMELGNRVSVIDSKAAVDKFISEVTSDG